MLRPTGPIPIRLILDGQNETVLTGSIRILSDSHHDGASGNGTASEEEEPYDYHGAMLFTVLVITVYAISIVLLIASFIKKKQVLVSVEETKNVNQYLIQVSDLKEKTARENFKKLKRSIIEVVERSDSRKQVGVVGGPLETNRRAENLALKNAILGAGISLYSPLIAIKEEVEGGDPGNSRVVAVDIEHQRRSNGASPRYLYPPSGSVSPDSPSGGDQKPLLNSPPSSTTPVSPGTDSRRLLLDPDSPSLSSPEDPSLQEPIWLVRDDLGYKNATFLPSPSPRPSRHKPVPDDDGGGSGGRRAFGDVWLPLGYSSRTPSPSRRPENSSQDNAVSSV